MEMMNWLTAIDLFGVFVFALSGGLDGAKHRLDILGIVVLAVATGVGGGMMRDVLLGHTPPSVFTNEIYMMMCLLGAVVVILFADRVDRHVELVKVADAIGLGVFAAIGASKAIDAELGTIGVIMMSSMSAVGGGVIRDLLVREVPMVLRADFYASAAMLGGVAMLICHHLHLPLQLSIIVSALVVIIARFTAMYFALELPKVRSKKH